MVNFVNNTTHAHSRAYVLNQSQPTNTNDDNTTFSKISGYVGSAASASAATFMFKDQMISGIRDGYAIYQQNSNMSVGTKLKKTILSDVRESFTRLKSMGVGIAISGAISGVTNSIEYFSGNKTGGDAVGTVVADTISGAVSAGAAVGVAGGLGYSLSLVAPGFSGTALLMGAGVVAALSLDFVFRQSGAHDAVRNGVKGLIDKEPTPALT